MYDNNPLRNSLDIKFNQHLTNISLTFATFEYHGGPGVEPSNITLTAYMDSTATIPIGSAIARGTWPSGDSYPQGTLTFSLGDQAFNLVRIELPYQGPNGAVDFLVDNIKVTEAPIIAEFPTSMVLPLYIVVITLAVSLAKRKLPKTFG